MTLTTAVSPDVVTRRTARRALRYLPTSAFALDAAVVVAVVALAVLARDSFLDLDGARVAEYVPIVGPLMAVVWLAAIAIVGGYQAEIFGAGGDEFNRLLRATLLTAAAVSILCFLVQFPLSRGFFLASFLIGTPALLLGRALLRAAIHRAHRAGHLLSRVLIAGTPEHVDEVAAVLTRERWLGFSVIGALTSDVDGDRTPAGIAVLGSSDTVGLAVEAHQPDVVVFADNALGTGSRMRQVVWQLEANDVRVVVAPSVADVSQERVRVRPVGGLPLIDIEKPRHLKAASWAKRTFDVVGVLAIIVAVLPVLVFAAIRIKAHDRGPVLFRQTRVGRDGSAFECLKFRTMVVDAEARLDALKAMRGDDDVLFKLRDDPRITTPGSWLRRFSFDELPQLFNVLRGDMSLIGPRPCLPGEYARYTDDQARRLRVRPGMTGLWQVSGRSDLDFEEAVRLDLFYVDNWSMLSDLGILFRTFGAVAGSRGAY